MISPPIPGEAPTTQAFVSDGAPVANEPSRYPWPLTSRPLTAQPLVAAPAKAATTRARLLLVEDHAPTRNSLAHVLGRRNYEVLAADTVAAARNFAAGGNIQLIISDIGLPDGDGYELMSGLRADHPALPGIAITGYGMPEDFARSRHVGFAHHFIKPLNIPALEAAIESLLASSGKSAPSA